LGGVEGVFYFLLYKMNTELDLELEKRLKEIHACYDVETLLKIDKTSENTAKYYRFSDWAYQCVHACFKGSIHMGLSKDGKFRSKDFAEQSNIIAKYIGEHTKKVLELGAGKLINTKLLAKRFPDVHFTALDLPNRNFKKARIISNISLDEGDYNDLTVYDPDSFDLIFAVETLGYGTSKEHIFQEVERILKPGGYFVIFDGYEAQPEKNMTKQQIYVSELTLAGMQISREDHYI